MKKLPVLTLFLWSLCLFLGCGDDGEQMRQQLEVLEQQNRSGEQMLNDSLAESLVDYPTSGCVPSISSGVPIIV